MKGAIQKSRYLFRAIILFFILFITFSAQYTHYVYTNRLNTFLESWPQSFQKSILQLLDFIYKGSTYTIDKDTVITQLGLLKGNTWSVQIVNFSMTDLLAGVESIFTAHAAASVILIGMAVPLLITLILGRVFCSWICPVGFILEITGKLRNLLKKSNLPVHNIKFWRMNKFSLLITGLLFSAIIGFPILGSLYPPALLVREFYQETLFLFERAENNLFTFSLLGLTSASFFIILIILAEIFISERMWCRYFCPGGALYAFLGSKRLAKVKVDLSKCTSCGECLPVCGMGLYPAKEASGIECDNCLACFSECPENALPIHIGKSTVASHNIPAADITFQS